MTPAATAPLFHDRLAALRDRAFARLLAALRRLANRPPDLVIGESENPYMRRWWIIPRNRVFNIYLHQILRSDDDRALHDHPWWNCSVLLEGRYMEVVPRDRRDPAGLVDVLRRKTGDVVFRGARSAHRLALHSALGAAPGRNGKQAVWTLFITGPVIRQWGFWCSHGWRSRDEFVADGPNGESVTGRGCD